MKPRRPTDFEVFNSNVKQIITKSDSVTEEVQKSKVPFKLDTYIGTTNSYFSDNGIQYTDGKKSIIFRLSDIPFRPSVYNRLQSSTYCKPFVKPGRSNIGDGVKKYYSSPSFSDIGRTLGVDRYLYTENNGNSIRYYFLGDGTDGTISGTKYYIKSNEVINNYLVPFTIACTEDKIIYPILVFVDGFFIPWSRCYFAVSYEEYKIYVDMSDLKCDQYTYLSDKVRSGLINGSIEPVFYMLPFEVKYGENTYYSDIDSNKAIFTFDSYGRSIMNYGSISDTTKVNYIEALINIKNINDIDPKNMYDQVSDLFYCEVNSGARGENYLGKTVIKFNKLDRMRKLFPNNIIVFNRTDDSNLNLTLCIDTIRIYNNIVYVGDGDTTYYDQHIKIFFDSNSALSLTNLEFVSQSWLENYTDILVNFYINNGINYVDSGEIDVPNNENKPIGLKVIDGVLNAEFDPQTSDTYDLFEPTQLGYTIKDGILCLEFDELNPNKLIINDNYISEQLNSGSLFSRFSMDMDEYNFDELRCYYLNSEDNSRTELPIDKKAFFSIFNKLYIYDAYNKNKGRLPVMDQTTIKDQTFEIKDIGTLTSIYSYRVGHNITLNNMSFNDAVFIDKCNRGYLNPIGPFKFVYVADNQTNDRYGNTSIETHLFPHGIDPDSVKIRTAKFIEPLMKDDLESPLGLEVGYKGYQYSARIGYTAYTDYTYSVVASNIEGYTASDGKLLIPVEALPDEEHDSFYFIVNTNKYYVKEYSNEYYDNTTGKVVNKTGYYNLDKEYMDFSGIMTSCYDENLPVLNEARMNNVQLSNTEISIIPNPSTTIDIYHNEFDIDTEKYISNFNTPTPIITNFVCTFGGTLDREFSDDLLSTIDRDAFFNTFHNHPGTYNFTYNEDLSLWIVNGGSYTFASLSDCYINDSRPDTTEDFYVIISIMAYPTWAISNIEVDIKEQYGITFDGVCNEGDILSITYTKNVTGLLEETYNEKAENCETIMNDYLQLKLVDGVTNVVYNNYLIDINVDPYKSYPGRVEFKYNYVTEKWTATVFKYITDDIVYSNSFIVDNLDSFGIEYEGIPEDGDTIIIHYEPTTFKWNMFKATTTHPATFLDGYIFPDEPTYEDINISEFGIGLMATINQTNITNAKISNEDLLAEKLHGVSGIYLFTYDSSIRKWKWSGDNIESISDYGIDIGDYSPNNGDYIMIELNTGNSPSWMDTLFITIYETNVNCIEFPDGTYYDKETAIPIILESYGVDISKYSDYIKMNDKIIIEYHNSVGIPRYILNLLINKFDYIDSFNTNRNELEDTYPDSYETYNDKLYEIYKDYKLYEYQLTTMMANNQTIFNKYLTDTFSNNTRFTEYTREYLIREVAKEINNKYYIDIPRKNLHAYMIDFENMFLNFYSNDNLEKDIDSNIFRYQLALDRYSSGDTPVEFIFFDNIDNSVYKTRVQEDYIYRRYDKAIFNDDTMIYTTIRKEDNEFQYPESEDGHPIDMKFNIKLFHFDKMKYKGIIKPGSSESDTAYTPAASYGDFYYINNSGYINGVYVDASNYRLLFSDTESFDAREGLFDELKPAPIDPEGYATTNWILIESGDGFIEGVENDDYSSLILDQEYISVWFMDDSYYDTDLYIVSRNRFMYHQFQYKEPTGDYDAIDNDRNSIVLEDENHNDIFCYCDDSSRYMIFIAEKSGDSHKEYRYVSSDQYRISIPSDYEAPYYKRKVFFTFNIPQDAYIAVFYLPMTMEAVEFKQRTEFKDGTVIFDIDYEAKKDTHYTIDSDLFMVFSDGKKIPQSWIESISPNRLAIRDPNNSGIISYNNISIVRYIPTILGYRFDSYIDSRELRTVGNFEPYTSVFLEYIMRTSLSKMEILDILEKIAYRLRYARSGTRYELDDDLVLDSYGSGMSEFIYWLYNDMAKSSEQRLNVFDYDAIDLSDVNSFNNNNRFIEATIKLIREFYIRNTLVPYNTHENPDPTFSDRDNIAAKSEGLTRNWRESNGSWLFYNNIYAYPAMQDYRFDVIFSTFNLHNLTTNGKTTVNPGEVDYTFNLYPVNNSHLPENITITIDNTGIELIDGKDYSYNRMNGSVTIYNITDNFTVTAYGEVVSYIEIAQMPDRTLYYTTERFDPTGMSVIIHWTNGSSEFLTDYTWDHYNELLTTDITQIVITYRDNDYYDYTAVIPINVLEATAELNYSLSNDGTYYIVGDGTNGSGLSSIPENSNIVIPSSIYDTENNVDYKIKVISDGAFRNIQNITSISLGYYVYDIGNYAFSGCSVSSINLNKKLLTIGDGAFKDCVNIDNIIIPESVVSIGISILRGCTSLKEVHMYEGIPYITQTMFEGCTSLKDISIPSTVKSLGIECFSGCTSLKTIGLTDNITSIGSKAFYHCSSLESIAIPVNKDMTIIKDNTFNGCKLGRVDIPNNINIIEDSAFANCTSLTRVYFQVRRGDMTGINSLGASVFEGCTSLTRVQFAFNASVNKCTSSSNAWFKGCNENLTVFVPEAIFLPGEYDLTYTNYGDYWTYIDNNTEANYFLW